LDRITHLVLPFPNNFFSKPLIALAPGTASTDAKIAAIDHYANEIKSFLTRYF